MLIKIRMMLISLVLMILSTTLMAQGRLDISRVNDGLYVITGPGGNIGVRVTDEGVILIDDKFPEDFSEIQSLVASVSDLPVRYIINTHHHGDHSGSNAGFLQMAEIIIHRNARDNMVRGNQPGVPGWFIPSTLQFLLVELKLKPTTLAVGILTVIL